MEIFSRNAVLAAMAVLFTAMLPSTSNAAEPKSMGEAKFLDVDGIRTRYFEGGRGEAMLLIHGASFGNSDGAAHNWMPIFPILSENFHVYAMDKLGMGLTDNPRDDDGYMMQATVQHIYRFMELLEMEKVHLVGHSRGGLPVAYIALEHPDRLKTLTIFNSGTLSSTLWPQSAAALSTDLIRPSFKTKESVRQHILRQRDTFNRQYVTDEYVEAELEVARQAKISEAGKRIEILTNRFIDENPDKVRKQPALRRDWWLDQVLDETLQGIRAGRLEVPTLIIWGSSEPIKPPEQGLALYELIRSSVDNAELHFFNRCGHFPFQEYPQRSARVMKSFIEGV